ncbi:hypothetical protein [Microvirga solisilvae]|uniref:hypothetical protein n=1 Tax=Microvirga solisilvae TaxID=2919498 RepID=UPI001FB023BA|nr:hypothetical protein [Microvirga solisilvae]
MDFARLALRLAAIETLAPSAKAADAPWPTLSGPFILDSQIEPTDQRMIADKQPLTGVFTDDDEAQPYGSGVDIMNGADATVTLSFESVVPMRLAPAGATAGELAFYAVTNPQIEARLDLLCGQIMHALRHGLTDGPLRHVVKSFTKRETHTFRDADTDSRLNARRLSLTVGVKPSFDLGDPTATGLDRLPEPLRSVAKELPPGSYGRKICEALAAAGLAGPPDLPSLAGIDFKGWVGKAEPDPAEPDVTGTIPTT